MLAVALDHPLGHLDRSLHDEDQLARLVALPHEHSSWLDEAFGDE